ncbi:MAG: hypothetical protein KI792_08435 [Alphaproteobacteria bacterium]|nr:hypothetical protein [Alphaproteobacteria bacterium SS10]
MLKQNRPRRYLPALILALVLGFGPALANWIVDPFRMNNQFDLGLDREEISLRAHYPLWKMIEYPRRQDQFIVLGDSRARALQDKYWNEVGVEGVYNFAYGGATIFEIYDTFKYLQDRTDLETLVVSLPLRSFDERHKGGLNRVPEAIRIADSPFEYYTSWFVLKTAIKNLEDRYGEELHANLPSLTSTAHAAATDSQTTAIKLGEEPVTLEVLLDPENCKDCEVDQRAIAQRMSLIIGDHSKGPNLGLGRGLGHWSAIWQIEEIERDLPSRFAKQVGTNGAADWRRFQFSDRLWSKIVEIADWTRQNDVQLVFVIPPTITEMQQRLNDFGMARANNDFRLRLAELAPVVDFDFDSAFTRDLDRFTDAYHFDANAAREIVAQLARMTVEAPHVQRATRNFSDTVECPLDPASTTNTIQQDGISLSTGKGCRIWKGVQ